jgi:fibronectin-binding autotransporter adhesin
MSDIGKPGPTRRSAIRTAGAVISATVIAVLLAGLTALPAAASGCTDTWTNTAGGSWFTGANWSKGTVPSSSDEACITESGTYTVSMTQTSASGTVTLKSLTLGGASGKQTLVVGSSGSLDAVFTTSTGASVAANGILELTNTQPGNNPVTVNGPTTNNGTLISDPTNGAGRTLTGALLNQGTLTINTNTSFNGEGATLTNEGAINIATADQLAVSNKGLVINASGGQVAASGTGVLIETAKSSFDEGAGTTTGTLPVIVDDGALSYEGSGESTIALRGTSTLKGATAAKQTLLIQSTFAENNSTTAPSGFSNGGSTTLANAESGNNSVRLTGTITNTGTITTDPTNGAERAIDGNLTNKGTLAINTNTVSNSEGSALTNEGAVDIATGTQLQVSNKQTVSNGTGGHIVASGSGVLLETGGSSFDEGAGTTSGTLPVIVDDGTLSYEGAGESTIALRGTSTLKGASTAKQTLLIQSTFAENNSTTAPSGFSNGGSTTLANTETGNNSVRLIGAITNTGTITTDPTNGAERAIDGNLTNKGTLAIDTNTISNGASTTLTNEGAIDIANGASFALGTGDAVLDVSGTIAAAGSGTLSVSHGTFTQNLTTLIGAQPVTLDDCTLTYAVKGKGKGTIAVHGTTTLTGTINSKQVLEVQATFAEDALVNASSFTSSGTISLANTESGNNTATLNLAGGTLTNKGTIEVEALHGAARTISGNLINEKTLTIEPGITLSVTGTYSQGKKGTFSPGIVSSTSFGELAVAKGATIEGALKLVKPGASAEGSKLLVLSAASLSGTFTKVSGNKIKKTKLLYVPVYSPTAVTLEVQL